MASLSKSRHKSQSTSACRTKREKKKEKSKKERQNKKETGHSRQPRVALFAAFTNLLRNNQTGVRVQHQLRRLLAAGEIKHSIQRAGFDVGGAVADLS